MIHRKVFLGTKKDFFWTDAILPKPRQVAFMLELEWPYKRHAGISVVGRSHDRHTLPTEGLPDDL